MASTPPPQMAPPQEGPARPAKKPVWMWIVIGILGGGCVCTSLIAAVLYPVFVQARDAAKVAVCRENMQAVGDAIVQYAETHNGRFPAKISLARQYMKVSSDSADRCPSTQLPGFGMGYAMRKIDKPISQMTPQDKALPLLIEVDHPHGDDVFTASTPVSTRHLRGRRVNAYYIGPGATTVRLEDAQVGETAGSLIHSD